MGAWRRSALREHQSCNAYSDQQAAGRAQTRIWPSSWPLRSRRRLPHTCLVVGWVVAPKDDAERRPPPPDHDSGLGEVLLAVQSGGGRWRRIIWRCTRQPVTPAHPTRAFFGPRLWWVVSPAMFTGARQSVFVLYKGPGGVSVFPPILVWSTHWS